jgi:LemA protein
MEALIPLALLALVVAMPLVWFIASYNRFARLRQHLRESWSDIEVEMQRRYELIPNLVETVKGYATHERDLLSEVVQLRNRAQANHGSATSQATDERALSIGVTRLLAVAEAYPDLKASSHFLALQQELANTEDRIAAARRFFNGNVRELNALCESFPTNFVASLFGFTRSDYFDAVEGAERVPATF